MQTPAYLSDHRIRGTAVLPGSFFVAHCAAKGTSFRDVRFNAMRFLTDDDATALTLQEAEGDVRLMVAGSDEALASASSGAADASGAASTHSSNAPGEVSSRTASSNSGQHTQANGSAGSADADEHYDRESLYARLARQGNDYGPAFQTIVSLDRKGDAATARWQAADGLDASARLITLIDACTHAAAIAAGLSTTYYLHGIAGVQFLADAASSTPAPDGVEGADAAAGRTIHAVLRHSSGEGRIVDCRITDIDGNTVIALDGLELRAFADAGQGEGDRLSIAATFTLDPLDDILGFWSRRLALPMALARADFGQVFQPLLSADTVFDEKAQSHTCLVRVADWAPQRQKPATPASEALDTAIGKLDRHLLPDGRTIASLNKYESAYLYQEIYNDLAYRRHGVRVLEGDTVVDIGANIGLFTLFATQEAPNVRVISVEPSPVVLPILKANRALYAPNGFVIEAGASDAIGEARFTAYRNSSVFSSFDADEGADEEAIRQVIRNSLEAMGQDDESLLEEAVEEMIQGRMDAEEFDCPLISVSDIIREHGLERIELLKIDAEKSEDAILSGIDEEHWPLIEQLIIEVHLQGGRSDREVIALLERHGFDVVRDEEELLNDSGLIGLYAARPERFARNAAAGEGPAVRESVDLFVDAAKAHAARSAVALDVVLCPADIRDPVVRELYRDIEGDLAARLADLPKTTVIDWEAYAEHYPVEHAHDALGGSLADMPYTPEWYAATGSALVRRHVSTRRQAAKVMVLDCDNTLWAGVVGEDGVDGVRFEPEHHALHASIRRLIDQGVLFTLASKNALADVRAVFDGRDEMALSWSDVVASRVNWQPKADNLVELASELNLGLDAFVFLDDSPLEVEEMRVRLPEVMTLQMPAEPAAFGRFLDHVWAFDQRTVTAEDERRAAMYREESQRRAYREDAGSIKGFIEGLKLDVQFAPIDDARLERASQMTQRTNQFNFTTVRRSVEELREWLAADAQRGGHVLSVADRFGDYGVTGLVLFEAADDALVVDTFLLSCRVLGRGVEHRVVARLGEIAGESGLAVIRLAHLPTAKNEPARRFMAQLPGETTATGDSTALDLVQAQAAALTHDPLSAVAASEAVAEGASKRPPLPAAPSVDVESIACDLATAAGVADAVRTRARVPRPVLETAFLAPSSDVEKQLATIWGDLLGIDGIGSEDGFFALGGSSLGAVQMVAEVQRSLGLSLSVVDVFDAPTIAGLARAAAGSGKAELESSRQRGAERRAQRPARRPRRERS